MGDIDRHFGDEDVVGGDRDPGEAGDPPGMASHRLDDHDPSMALGRRAEAVDRLGHDIDGGVEAEGEVGHHQVVVDRLGDAHHRHMEFFVQAMGDPQGIVAADGHEGIEPQRLEIGPERGDVGGRVLEGIGARRPEDRPPLGDDLIGLGDVELARHAADEPSPAFEDPDARAPAIDDALDHGPDHRIQTGAIATAGQ